MNKAVVQNLKTKKPFLINPETLEYKGNALGTQAYLHGEKVTKPKTEAEIQGQLAEMRSLAEEIIQGGDELPQIYKRKIPLLERQLELFREKENAKKKQNGL